MLKKIGKLFFLLLILNVVSGQTVDVRVDRNTVEVGENFDLNFVFKGLRATPSFKLPTINGFQTLNGGVPSRSTNMQIVNGRITQSATLGFSLRALSEGNYTIPSFTIAVAGKNLKTASIRMRVVKKSVETSSSQEVFLRLSVSSTSIYMNEEVTVSTRLYIKNGTRIYQNNISFSKLPSHSGVWKEKYELDGFKQLPSQTVKGVNYNVYLIEKDAMFPTITGNLNIESAEISMNIVKQAKKRRRSFFDDILSSGRAELKQITIRAPARKIVVKPFPGNLPDNFSNFAGKLSLTAKLDKTDAKTNEGVKLTIILNGSGNIQTLQEPSFYISPDIEQYEPTVRSTIKRKGNKISGRKIIEYVLVPRVEGQLKIGPIEFSYWNTSTNKVEILSKKVMILNISQGKSFAAANTGNGVSKKDVRQLDVDIRYIRSDSETFQSINSNLLSNPVYQSSYAAVIFLYFIGFFYLKKQSKLANDINLQRKKGAQGKVSRILKEARNFHDQKDTGNFFQAINRAICQYIADKTAKDAAGFTSDSIQKTLRNKQIEDQLIKDVLAITEKCDFYRFANPNNPTEEMESIWDQSNEVLARLTKAL